MQWILIALLAPALYSAINHFDKYLLSKHFSDTGAPVLILFSSLVGLLIAPIIVLFRPEAFALPVIEIVALMGSGILFVLALFPYFAALEDDDASLVAPMFQLIPVFAYILAFAYLGESLRGIQIIGSLIVVVGAMGMSIEQGTRMKVKWSLLGLIGLSSLIFAVDTTLFKIVAVSADFWVSTFWQYVGFAVPGVLMLLFDIDARHSFFGVFRKKGAKLVSLNGLNELLNMGAKVAFNYASLLAPLSLVWVVNGFQPFFVFVYGVLLTLFFPHIAKEDISRPVIVQKLFFIIIMVLGAGLIR